MERPHRASTCRWAQPTLFCEPPFWLYAWDAPWTCVRTAAPRLLGTTEPCGRCPRWKDSDPGEPVDPARARFDGC